MPPYETYVVKTTDLVGKTNAETIANDITDIYERVAKVGGKVVAQCVIDKPVISKKSKWSRRSETENIQAVFITAELPDDPTA